MRPAEDLHFQLLRTEFEQPVQLQIAVVHPDHPGARPFAARSRQQIRPGDEEKPRTTQRQNQNHSEFTVQRTLHFTNVFSRLAISVLSMKPVKTSAFFP